MATIGQTKQLSSGGDEWPEQPCTGSVAGGWIPVNTGKASTRRRAR